MRVLHIIFSLRTGGAETMLVDIVNYQRQKAEVTLLIVNDEIDSWVRDAISENVKVVEFHRKPGSSPLRLLWNVNKLIIQLKPEAIHIHNSKMAPLVRVRRKRLVFTVHDLKIPLNTSSDVRMCAISEAVKDDILSRYPGADVCVVQNGIHTEKIVSRREELPHQPFRLVHVGRFEVEKKGQDILIAALSRLRNKGVNVNLTLIGEGSDREMLENQAKEYGISRYVHFAGKLTREEIYARLSEYDAMCHPARKEGFGLTVAEGAAAGLPLIVPDEGGPFELTDKGRFAETFRTGDPQSCSRAILKVIENYPMAILRAKEAKKYVERNYSVENMAENYMSIYKSIIKPGTATISRQK